MSVLDDAVHEVEGAAARKPCFEGPLRRRRFNRWTVIAYAGVRYKHPMWLCRCDCGAWAYVRQFDLTQGARIDCGQQSHLDAPGDEAVNPLPAYAAHARRRGAASIRLAIAQRIDARDRLQLNLGGKG